MNSISRQFKYKMALASIASLLAMSYIDYVTGYELVFSAAYLLPVSLCIRYFGRREVWLMAIASGVAAWFVDAIDGHEYSHFMIEYWNSLTGRWSTRLTGLLL